MNKFLTPTNIAHHDQLSYVSMKPIGQRTSESCIHKVNRDGRTDERTNRKTICSHTIVYGAYKIKRITQT